MLQGFILRVKGLAIHMIQKSSNNIVFGVILIFLISLTVDTFAKTRAEFLWFEAMRPDVKPDHALAMLDSLSIYHSSELTEDQKVKLLKRQVELSMEIGKYNTAAQALIELKEHQGEFDLAEKMRMDLNRGVCSYYAGEYASAIDSAFAVLAEEKQESMQEYDIEAYLLLSNVAIRINAPDESLRFLNLAKESLDRLRNDSIHKVCEYKILLGQSGRSLIKGDYRNAYRFLMQADSLGVHGVSPFCLETNLALVYQYEGVDDIAERYYKEIFDNPSMHYNRCVALNNYTDFLMSKGRLEDALKIMDHNGPELAAVDATHALAVMKLMRFQTLVAMKDYPSAIESADSAINIMMDLLTKESRGSYFQINEKFHADKELHELADVKKENKRLYVISGALMLALLFIGVWTLMIKRQKKRLSLRIEESETELASLRSEYCERIEGLQEELDLKNRELTKLELKNSQIFNRFDSLASNPDLHSKGALKIAGAIKSELKALSRDDSDWKAFEVYFQQVHPDFFDRLLQNHPDLTRGERRMCAFIRMGMKTSEIASLCNRSPRTIDSMKYRLKKKLDIPQGESLDNYLIQLS